MAELRVRNLEVRLGGRPIVREVSLSLRPGELVALLGPNGAGKTTLLRAALGLIPPDGGSVRLDGLPPSRLSPAARARRVGYLPQHRPLAWPNRVRDLVALGRFAHGATPGRLGPADRRAVDAAIRNCGLERFRSRAADTLSGGEQALVHCARVFASEAPLLLVDEPVAALDPRHQLRVMGLLRRRAREGGGVLAVLHDIAVAARWADRICWMRDGRLVAGGAPGATLTPETLAAVYDVPATVFWEGRTPIVILPGPERPEGPPGDEEKAGSA